MNSLRAWKQSDDTITFDPIGSTMMACDKETWLGAAASATIDGDRLLVLDSEDEQIGTLDRN